MEKKNPFVTTVGFKKDDPDHIYVAKLLNSMGRGKAQYIVKAVIQYQNMRQSGEMIGSSYTHDKIRSIVYQVMEERERQGNSYTVVPIIAKQEKVKPMEENNLLSRLDDNALNGILASIAAFQEQ